MKRLCQAAHRDIFVTEQHCVFTDLIFDLDDTLLDTSGQLIQPAIRESCKAMVDTGLNTDLETCVRLRKEIFAQTPRENIYRLLVNRFGLRPSARATADQVAEAGHRAFFQREIDPGIKMFEEVPDLLRALGSSYRLHLVTSGDPATQRKKIEILEIRSFFHSIHLVPPGAAKGNTFEMILTVNRAQSDRILCTGDRIDREIREANALGIKTCLVLYGEYSHLQPGSPEEEPDFRIAHIREFPTLPGIVLGNGDRM